MQWLTLVSEDNGLQRLKADNRRPSVARAVDPVYAYPSTHPASIGDQQKTLRQGIASRHQEERRKGGDRRCKQVPVILDTRCNNDRRALHGARSADGNPDTPRQRINVYA